MRRAVLLLVLAVLLAASLIVLRPDGAGTSTADLQSLAVKLGALVLGGAILLALMRQDFVRSLTFVMAWAVIGLAIAVVYTWRGDLASAGRKLVAEVTPRATEMIGMVRPVGPTFEVVKGRGGEMTVRTTVNEAEIVMVLDTGASRVVLTHEAARAAGLPMVMLDYDVVVETANGRARAAAVILDRLAIGPIVERKVPALVAPAGQLKVSLLGMTFLSRLESWEMRDGRMILRGYP
jgi:aspartyl protease family protein